MRTTEPDGALRRKPPLWYLTTAATLAVGILPIWALETWLGWAQVYRRAFAESTPILPRSGNHLPPDAAHFSLQVLLAGAVVTGARALLKPRTRKAFV